MTVFFMHIARTAGRSTGEVISANFSNVADKSLSGYIDLSEDYSSVEAFIQHDLYNVAKNNLVNPTMITFIRNPVDSAYSFCKNVANLSDEQIIQTSVLDSIANDMVKRLVFNSAEEFYTRTITALDIDAALINLQSFDFVGNFDDYENEINRMCDQFGWTVPSPLPHVVEESWQETLTIPADVRTHIETYCSSDIELFQNFYK